MVADADANYHETMKNEGVTFVDEIDADLWRAAAKSVYDNFEKQDVLAQVQEIIAANK